MLSVFFCTVSVAGTSNEKLPRIVTELHLSPFLLFNICFSLCKITVKNEITLSYCIYLGCWPELHSMKSFQLRVCSSVPVCSSLFFVVFVCAKRYVTSYFSSKLFVPHLWHLIVLLGHFDNIWLFFVFVSIYWYSFNSFIMFFIQSSVIILFLYFLLYFLYICS